MPDKIKIFTPERAEQERNKLITEFTQLTERYNVQSGVFVLFLEHEIIQFTTNAPGSPHRLLATEMTRSNNEGLKQILGNRFVG